MNLDEITVAEFNELMKDESNTMDIFNELMFGFDSKTRRLLGQDVIHLISSIEEGVVQFMVEFNTLSHDMNDMFNFNDYIFQTDIKGKELKSTLIELFKEFSEWLAISKLFNPEAGH